MAPSLSPILITLGLIFNIFAIIVESDAQKEMNITPASSPPPPPPPPPKSPAPPATQPLPASTPPPTENRPPLPSPNRIRNKSSDNGSHRRRPPSPPPKKHEHTLNIGKMVGLFFAGIAAILQIGVLGFLVFKRRQLLKISDRYETCSASTFVL